MDITKLNEELKKFKGKIAVLDRAMIANSLGMNPRVLDNYISGKGRSIPTGLGVLCKLQAWTKKQN